MKEINVLLTEDNLADDFFICVGSPEDRCTGSVAKFDLSYKADEIILLKYSDSFNRKREENVNFIKNCSEKIGKYTEFLVDEEKPIPILKLVIDTIKEKKNLKNKLNITIDFSTMIKWHFLILLKALLLNGLLQFVRFIYTEPEEYITDLFQPLSFGLKNIFPIPSYYGDYDFSKETTLVIFLGYEGDRAISIFEKLDPSDCILLIGKPAYHIEWDGRTEEMNKDLINLVGNDTVKYVDSRNPILISNQLKSILEPKKYSNSNKLFAPLGPKPQILGLFYFLYSDHSLNNLIYSSPLRHNHLFYSTGIGSSWIIPNIFNTL